MTENEKTTDIQPSSKEEIILHISRTLAERRQARNLSYEKITQAIKIRIPYLQAIEKGQWQELPAEVYIRGFIRRYAQYLGLDGAKLIAPYIQIVDQPVNKAQESGPLLKGGEFSRAQLIVVGGVVLFLVLLIKLFKEERSAVHAPRQEVPVVAPAARPPESAAPSENVLHEIRIFSPNPLWLRITAPGKTFEGFIPQASTWNWTGGGDISVRLGHTREVSLFFDGKPINLAENQRKIDFPSAN